MAGVSYVGHIPAITGSDVKWWSHGLVREINPR